MQRRSRYQIQRKTQNVFPLVGYTKNEYNLGEQIEEKIGDEQMTEEYKNELKSKSNKTGMGSR
jgi:Tfp pilus assembly protein PilF